MAKITIIKIEGIEKNDGSIAYTPESAQKMLDGNIKVVAQSARKTVGKEDLFIKHTVDTDLDKKAQLIVPPTHVAILVKDGLMLQTLEAGKYFVYDKSSDLKGIFFKKYTTDSVDIIYISKTAKMRMGWGTREKLDLRDPLTDVPIKAGVGGEFEIQINDPRKFYLEVVGMDKGFDILDLQKRLIAKIMSRIQPVFAKAMREKNISYTTVNEHTVEIATEIAPIFNMMFQEEYGLKICDFFISDVIISEESKARVEAVLKQERDDKKTKEKKAEFKTELKEDLAELERLEDKEWERAKYMMELESRDYERYLEVCKIIGWNKKEKDNDTDKKKDATCAKCGNAIKKGEMFCSRCGTTYDGKIKCPDCGKLHEIGNLFCSGCGRKLKGDK